MKVMKFGGTSVGTPERMKEVTALVTKFNEPVFVVLSAMSGTTNSLVEISDYLYKKNPDGANEVINRLEQKYDKHVDELYTKPETKAATREFLKGEFDYLRSFTKELFTSFEEKSIVAQGEIISTNMVVNYMNEIGIKAVLLNALDFMRTDKNAEPDPVYIKEKLAALMKENEGAQVYLTQGFICRNAYGEIDNLQRGGSDYTASLIGAAIAADEIQIWTDIDGMHNNDPRVVDGTEPVHQLHFEEAAELAYFGAKILHPTCVQPAKYAGIPVRLLNTMDPDAEGTTISNKTEYGKIKAIAAKDNITAIKMQRKCSSFLSCRASIEDNVRGDYDCVLSEREIKRTSVSFAAFTVEERDSRQRPVSDDIKIKHCPISRCLNDILEDCINEVTPWLDYRGRSRY